MRMTRRSLIQALGLGAAAAALAPSIGQAASEPRNEADPTGTLGKPCHQCQPNSAFPHVYGHSSNESLRVSSGTTTLTGDLTVTSGTLRIDNSTMVGWTSNADTIGFSQPNPPLPGEIKAMQGMLIPVDDALAAQVQAYHRGREDEALYGNEHAIAQARADGYNRGREVESAAWEARQFKSVFSGMIDHSFEDRWKTD